MNRNLFKALTVMIFLALFLPAVCAGPTFEIKVLDPNGGEVLKGTYDVSFKWKQRSPGAFKALVASVFYSSKKGEFENPIDWSVDLLDAENCNDVDNNPTTWQVCTLKWKTFEAPDGEYFLDVRIQDHSGKVWEDSSDNSFIIDNFPPSTPEWVEFNDLIEIIPDYKEIYMANKDTVTVSFSIENISSDKQCLTLEAKEKSNYINASIVGDNEFCLNANEKTIKTLSISTNYAQNTTYPVELLAKIDGTDKQGKAIVKVHVGEKASIAIVPSEDKGTVCSGKSDDIFFHVKNYSEKMKTVKLALSGPFMPTLKETEITLDPKEDYYPVEINLYVPNSTKEGEYSVVVTAITDDAFVSETIFFDVDNTGCKEATTPLFELNVDEKKCVVAQKDEETVTKFSVKNLSNNVLKVYFTTISDFWTDVQESVELEPKEEKEIEVILKPVLKDAAGENYVQVVAWSGNESLKKSFCIKIAEKNHAVVNLEENNLEGEQGEQLVFVLRFENDGDKEQYYTLTNVDGEYEVSISNENFSLKPNKQKEVFISVSLEGLAVGKHTAKVLVEEITSGVINNKPIELNFIVKEKTVKNLKFDSLPYKITMKQGQSGIIQFSLTNLSNVDLEKVTLSVEGLPKGVSTAIQEFDLKKGVTKTLTQQISVADYVEPDLYKIKVVAKTEDFEESHEAWLYVLNKNSTAETQPPKEPVSEDIMAGLAALGGSVGVGVLLLIVIAILLIALFYYGSKRNGDSTKKQSWIRKSRRDYK